MSKYQEVVCPKCSTEFSVVEGDDVVLCEACKHPIDLSGDSRVLADATSRESDDDLAKDESEDTVNDKSNSEDETRIADEEAERQKQETQEAERLAKLLGQLPPKFLANDPDYVDHRVNRERQSTVLIPRADGGVQSVDANVVRINHKGQIVE